MIMELRNKIKNEMITSNWSLIANQMNDHDIKNL